MFEEACDGLRHAPGNARLAKYKALAVVVARYVRLHVLRATRSTGRYTASR